MERTRLTKVLFGTASILAVACFTLDAFTPLGVADGVLYVVLVLLTLWVPEDIHTYLAAAAATFLTLLGWAFSPKGPLPFSIVLTNRGIALFTIWIAAALVLYKKRTDRALISTLRELTDVKYALDQSSIVAITDQRGIIKYVNDKFCEISRYPREELLGQDHRILNSGHHPKAFMRELWTTISRGAVWRGEIRNRAKDGTIYWVDTTIVPFLTPDEKPYQYLAIRSDITEKKRVEEALRDQAALARLGEMAAVVAHEVKNPLAGIGGALQVIRGGMPETSRERPIIDEILARLQGLNALVRDLLVFARPRPPRLDVVPMEALLRETVGLLLKDPDLANVTVDLSGETPVLRADAEMLRIVFLNLFLNAAQAMGSKGTVRVVTSAADGMCRVAISDSGPGIPAEARARIFEPFFTTKHRGTGLGLPVVKRVVDAHGGSITVECPEGGGTTATVSLPLQTG